ncbi:glucokinase [Thiomicrospira sp. R3]|uniref:glucokinase n=1 Tax=Thiomicrospira sp. R3 TaxID=3035472 RepID=UPI00259BC195|nr:glucokinase [Thiomicrospira sp. R3]WFE68157.1 glucokinase [Thiomicrospira sp. R3]
MLVLAGDIGGTKALLQAIDLDNPRNVVAQAKFPSQSYDSLESIIHSFCSQYHFTRFEAACFGLPGPVSGRKVALTNLPWVVDADQLQHSGHIKNIELINDFQAAAFGIDALNTDQLVELHAGEFDGRGNRLVVGAGTGLGVAPVVRCLNGFWPQPCEGGHMDFAPQTPAHQTILVWFWQLWSHVSFERILSGAGLEALYAFHAGLPAKDNQAWLSAPQVHQLAEEGDDVAKKALDSFVEIYGGYIGNLALLWPARAGIYIAGGIGAKIEHWMRQPAFLTAMHSKGRMSKLVQSMPVYLVKDETLGLKGAAVRALRLIH